MMIPGIWWCIPIQRLEGGKMGQMVKAEFTWPRLKAFQRGKMHNLRRMSPVDSTL
jgi:hypothetical protein